MVNNEKNNIELMMLHYRRLLGSPDQRQIYNEEKHPSISIKIYTTTTPNPQGMLHDPRPGEDATPSEATRNRKWKTTTKTNNCMERHLHQQHTGDESEKKTKENNIMKPYHSTIIS